MGRTFGFYLGLLVILSCLSACALGNGPSQAQVEKAKAGVLQARNNNLYVPADVESLDELHLNSGRYGTFASSQCVRASIHIAYQSPRSFADVLAEYRTELVATGWELDPSFPHEQQDIDFFRLNPKVGLTISSHPLLSKTFTVPTLTNQALTIYYLHLDYTDPSDAECVG